MDVGLQSSLNTDFNSDMQDTIMEMRAVAPNTLFRQRGIGGTALDPLPGCERTILLGLRAVAR